MPSVTLDVTPQTVTEDGFINLLYTFTRTGDTSMPLRVKYTVAGTASLGSDYTGISTVRTTKTLIIPAGSTTATVSVDPTADTSVEGDETVSLTLAARKHYTIGTSGPITGIIRNDDGVARPSTPSAVPSVSLSVGPAAVSEDGNGNLIYTFTRTGDASAALTVNYTVGGTATIGTDYTGISTTGMTKTVSFASGSATATVTVDPTADSSVEPDETVALTLATGSGYGIGTPGAVTGTIRNDDGTNQISLFDRPGVLVNAINKNDNSPVELGLVFNVSTPGKITELKYFRTAEDANDTDVRDLRLWRRSDGVLLATATITSTAGQSGWQRVKLSIPVNVVSGQEYIVSYKTGNNYALTENFFTPDKEIAFDGTDNNAFTDPQEVIRAQQSGVGTANSVYRYGNTLAMPDQTYLSSNYWVDASFSPLVSDTTTGSVNTTTPPTISLSLPTASVLEDGITNLAYTFTRTGSTSTALTVGYNIAGTATNGSDYGAIGTSVTFAPGSANATVTVNPTADSTVEPDETVALTLATGNDYLIGTSGPVTGTIRNDDVAGSTHPPVNPITDLRGWQLNATNVGLAPFGIDGSQLPVYTGPYEIPAGSYITGMKFTRPVSLIQGNITIEKSLFQPTSLGIGQAVVGATVYSNNQWLAPPNTVTIRDSEFDASRLPLENAAKGFAFSGLADLQRNYIHGFGIGISIFGTGRTLDGLIEHNYITDTPAFGNPGTTGNHIDAFTIRDFTDAQRPDRKLVVRNNRFDANAATNVTGAFFMQAWGGRIDNVSIEGNLLEGNGYNLILEANANGYSNISATDNRFAPTGYGATYNTGNGWTTWQNNYLFSPAMPGGMGAAVFP
jgi:hypothetical protein